MHVCVLRSMQLFQLIALNLLFFMDVPLISKKAMAPHSSVLAWKIPWTEGPGGLQSIVSLGVGHN